MLSVTERFAQWIKLSRLTQTEIARQLGRHKSFITQLKKGIKRPTLDDAVKLEAMTGIPAAAWSATRQHHSGTASRAHSRNSRVA